MISICTSSPSEEDEFLLPNLLSSVTRHALTVLGAAVLLVLSISAFAWRRAAKRGVQKIADAVPPLLVKRVPLTDAERESLRGDDEYEEDDAADGGETKPPRKRADDMAPNLSLSSGYAERMRKKEGLEVMSLGEYLSSLRPVGAGRALGEDIELLAGAALLKTLGPNLGMAIMPVMAALPKVVGMAAGMGGVAVAAAAVGAGATEEERDEKDSKKNAKTAADLAISTPAGIVRAVGGLSLISVAGSADLAAAVSMARHARIAKNKTAQGGNNAQVTTEKGESENSSSGEEMSADPTPSPSPSPTSSPTPPPKDPLAIMWRGEASTETFPPELLPNPFVLTDHWQKALEGMERHLCLTPGVDGYDPNELPMGEPAPVRDKLLPDLHIGMGGVKGTHTRREILANRLLSVLLNRLGTIDVLDEVRDTVLTENVPREPFGVKLDPNGAVLHRPERLVDALIESGHDVTAVVTTRITTFGMRLCVKDKIRSSDDDAGEEKGETGGDSESGHRWIQIPLGIYLRTGLQHPSTGSPVSAFLTHGGIDLTVRGPLIPNVMIQYYHNQEGYDGWGSGHYPDAPWCSDPAYSNRLPDPVRAVRMCGLLSCCENSNGSRLALPLGGYGLTGICNDSAAAVERALTGDTGVYPLLGIGGYKSQVVRRAAELAGALEKDLAESASEELAGLGEEKGGGDVTIEVVRDARRLRESLGELANDVHPVPSTEVDTARRMLKSCILDDPAFALMVDQREGLELIADSS